MNFEILTIGTELVLGLTLDTNGAEIARTLSESGVRIVRRTAVADRGDEIRDAVRDALARTGAVITTGGLGPTRDDITKRIVAELFGAPLEFDEAVWQALVARFARFGRVPVASNRVQAEVPRGALVLPNRWGTAPGLWMEGELDGGGSRGLVIMLPGVPIEMANLLAHEVGPRLAARAGGQTVRSAVVRTTGIPESTLAERLGEIEDAIAPLTLAYLPGWPGVDLRVTAWNLPVAEADARLRAAVGLLRDRAGGHAYGEGGDDLAAVVLELARAQGLRIGVAESCTGGLVGARLTDIPGSSDVFVGGVISYDDAIKSALLDVPEAVIGRYGAVSEEVARLMAEGAVRRLGVDLAVAVTGIAGPGGGSAEKPVGTVWFALAHGERVNTPARFTIETSATRALFVGTRAEIRARAAQAALYLAARRLR
ncbi:MAG TPA: CinA family nicotinamide mononucleotide deamidase-related protein [Gemmatimonadales bacterium]|nr:CinA family nicotinamide mononucleotide deamidase-related protein [Gemmatimonadales bacterium]